MRIDRMLTITVMLLNRDRISAKELATKFEVSVRTIYRDIDAINLAGIPIISYAGNSGGFGIMPNFKLDHQLLTFDDMVAVLSLLQGINNTIDDLRVESAIEKIKNLVPQQQNAELTRKLEQIVIDVTPWGDSQRMKTQMRLLKSALADNYSIAFNYESAIRQESSRIVDPITLVYKGYSWYLFAFCTLRNDYRLFKISRIKDLSITYEYFTPHKVSYRDYEKLHQSEAVSVKLVLCFTPAAKGKVYENFPQDAIMWQSDGSALVTITFPDDIWIDSFILGFGSEVEVISPDVVRQRIISCIDKISKTYSSSRS